MKKEKITIDDISISINQVNNQDYISLTDMVRNRESEPREYIRNWMRNASTVLFLGTWEKYHNPDFKQVEFDLFKSEAGFNAFTMSPKKWIEGVNAIGIISKSGRYGGTYAHKDIAFEFAMWLSAEFKVLLIKEFDRLKSAEAKRMQLGWDYQRYLSKVNYRLHTETIKDEIIPKLGVKKDRSFLVYADEADLLNIAVFGQTAKQWREANPDLARKGNIRDFAEIAELTILSNLESLNAVLIENGMDKEERFDMLARAAISQYNRLSKRDDIRYLGK